MIALAGVTRPLIFYQETKERIVLVQMYFLNKISMPLLLNLYYAVIISCRKVKNLNSSLELTQQSNQANVLIVCRSFCNKMLSLRA